MRDRRIATAVLAAPLGLSLGMGVVRLGGIVPIPWLVVVAPMVAELAMIAVAIVLRVHAIAALKCDG
jgi:hypothetical protein